MAQWQWRENKMSLIGTIFATLLNQTVHEHPEPGFWVEQQPFFCPAPAPTPTLLLKYVIFYVSKICFVFSIIKYGIK